MLTRKMKIIVMVHSLNRYVFDQNQDSIFDQNLDYVFDQILNSIFCIPRSGLLSREPGVLAQIELQTFPKLILATQAKTQQNKRICFKWQITLHRVVIKFAVELQCGNVGIFRTNCSQYLSLYILHLYFTSTVMCWILEATPYNIKDHFTLNCNKSHQQSA